MTSTKLEGGLRSGRCRRVSISGRMKGARVAGEGRFPGTNMHAIGGEIQYSSRRNPNIIRREIRFAFHASAIPISRPSAKTARSRSLSSANNSGMENLGIPRADKRLEILEIQREKPFRTSLAGGDQVEVVVDSTPPNAPRLAFPHGAYQLRTVERDGGNSGQDTLPDEERGIGGGETVSEASAGKDTEGFHQGMSRD